MIKEIEFEGERVFLKKDKTGIRVIHPIKIDGKINWKNLLLGGSWFNFFKWLVIFAIICFIMWSYKHDMANCFKVAQEQFIINMTNIQ